MLSEDILLVITAFQNNLINRKQLIDVFSQWVQNQSVPMRDVLIRLHALEPGECDLLSQMVQAQRQRHGEIHPSTDWFSAMPEVQSELAQIASQAGAAEVFKTLFSSSAEFPEPSMHEDGWWSSGIERFRIVREHARGGLGVVSMAEDKQFKREVACKQIRPDRADLEAYRHKFKREAEITGQLEHPGIVPIYALGTDKEGRPFYVMRFIRGKRLQDGIATFHQELSQNSLRYDGPQLRELLRHLIDACNAVEYAHEQGVLHRDLKPENVMLGRHGETLVVDWGLAKKLGASTSAAADEDLTCSLSDNPTAAVDPSGTRAGTFLGTIPYASPEQLLGQLDQLSPASDVYSLGAVLFSILTGQPPIQKTTSPLDAANQVESLEPSNLLRHHADIPQPLVYICLKAMSSQAQNRYHTAAELRDAIQLWLDDQAIPGMPEGPQVRLMRWVRKHQTFAATGLVGLVALVIFSAIVTLVTNTYLERERRQTVALNEANKKETAQRIAAENARLELLLSSAQLARDRGQFREAAERMREYQAVEKLTVEQQLKLSSDFYNAEDFRSARTLIEAIDRQQLSPAQTAQLQLMEGEMLLYVDKPEEGMKYIQQALDSQLLPAADQYFAKALLAESAIECKVALKECLRINPLHVGALTNLAFTCVAVGDFTEARSSIDFGLGIYPDEPRLLFSHLLVANITGDKTSASASLAKLKQFGTEKYLLDSQEAAAELMDGVKQSGSRIVSTRSMVDGALNAFKLATAALKLQGAYTQAKETRGVSTLPLNRWMLKLPTTTLSPAGLAAVAIQGGYAKIVNDYCEHLPNNQYLNYLAGCLRMIDNQYEEAGDLLLHAAECDSSAGSCAREATWVALANLTVHSVVTGKPIESKREVKLRQSIQQFGRKDGRITTDPIRPEDAWMYLVQSGMHQEAWELARQEVESADPKIRLEWEARIERMTEMDNKLKLATDAVIRPKP